MIKNRITILNILSYIIALMLILNCNTVYSFSYNFTNVQKMIMPIMVVSSIIYVLMLMKEYKKKIDNILILGLLVVLYLTFFFLISDFKLINSIKFIISFIVIFMLVWVERENGEISRVLNAYINLILIIAVLSVFFWLLGSILHWITPNKLVELSWGQYDRLISSYHNIYFETQMSNSVWRNSAVFTEAPMAALNFLLALALSVFFYDNKKNKNMFIIILIIAGLTTLSVTMYIGIIILFFLKFIEKSSINKKANIIKYLLSVVVLPIIIILINKLFNAKLNTQSGADRSLDYINSFLAWQNSPIFGQGINAITNGGEKVINGFIIENYGYSSSFTKILGDGGIYLLALIILAIVLSLRTSWINKDKSLLFLTIIVVYLFMVIAFAQNYLMYYLFIFIATYIPCENKRLVIKKSN